MAKTGIWIDGKQAASTLGELQTQVRKLNNEMKKLPVGSDEYNKSLKELQGKNKALTEHRNQIKGVADSYKPAKEGFGSLLKQFAPAAGVIGIATMAISGITSAVTSWYTNNREMEKSLSSLRSITGASVEDIAFYKEEAMALGRESTYSAMQIVEGYKLIGSARPELLKNKEALAQVTKETLTLAEAGEMDLAVAAQSMAGTMNQFNLSADQSGRIINTLAAGSKEGAAEINEVTESIDRFGTVANANNVTIEESVGLTELLAEKNIKGAEAGTQLRNVLLQMSTASSLPEAALASMKQYGVNLQLVQDKTVPLKERLQELSKVQGDQNALVKIFGKENVVAGQTILTNLDRLDELTNAVTGTNTAYEQAAINTDNLDGDLKSLSSAWEGLTLSMDGGGSIFRPIVQAGTDMLNWTSDTITAFKEWNTLDIETQYFKLIRAIPIVGTLFEDFLDQQIRMNEITSDVIDKVQAESDEMMVLTESLRSNNSQLKRGNVTEQESAKIKAENEKIISVLNEKYPELTKNIDLNKISASEMNSLQKELNKTILEQAINTAKAAEQERIIQEIISNTVEMQRRRAEEKGQGILKQGFNKMMGNHSMDNMIETKKLEKQLKNLDKDFAQVQKSIGGMNLEFGIKFKVNKGMVNSALKDLDKMMDQYEKTTDPKMKKILESKMKGLKETVRQGNKANQEDLNNILSRQEKADAQMAQMQEERAQKAKENHQKAMDHFKELSERLKSLTESTKKFKEEFNYQKELDQFKDAKQKELFELQHNLEQKYEKEIESATELSKQKGKIGIEGQRQLNALLALKEEELNYERQQINKKYEEERIANQVKNYDEEYKLRLDQQRSLEKAIHDIKVAEAQAALLSVAKNDIQGQKIAQDNLRQALIDQLEWETELKRQQLLEQNEEKKINDAELLLQVEDLERQKQERILAINKETNEKLGEIDRERLTKIVDGIAKAIDTVDKLQDAQLEIKLNRLETERQAEASRIKEDFDNKLISKEEYDKQIQALDDATNEKKKKIEYDAAVRQKEIAKAQALIGAAQAIIQSYAQLGPVAGAVAALLISATTAAQIGVIESTPLPQMYDGGEYHNVTGAKDGKGYRAKYLGKHPGGMLPNSPSLVLASEKGSEYYVPNHLLRDQRVVNHVRVIEAIRTNQFADGGFNGPIPTGGMSDDKLIKYLEANYAVLMALNNKIPNMGVKIGDKQIADLEERKTEIKNFRS